MLYYGLTHFIQYYTSVILCHINTKLCYLNVTLHYNKVIIMLYDLI